MARPSVGSLCDMDSASAKQDAVDPHNPPQKVPAGGSYLSTTLRVQCFGANRPQQGKTANEDGFLIGHGERPFALLCDGAGNAQQTAKRVLSFFDKLFKEAAAQQVSEHATWAGWLKLLDSSLLGGTQSTFLGVALLDGMAVGTCVGDSRAYLVTREGDCRLLTEGASKFRLGSGRAEAFPIRQTMTSGEILLLLSDGAWTPLGPYLLKKAVITAVARHFSDIPEAILEAAGRAGRVDDMTAIALRL